MLILLPSCFDDNNKNDYSEWKTLNDQYIINAEIQSEDGHLVYQKVVPVWDRSLYILMQWHNDRSENVNTLNPLSNSTVTLNYTLTNIEGDTLDQGASFSCKPNAMITGFCTAVTNMNVNDTVTAVVPYTAGYGIYGSGRVPPFSTLIFGIRLKEINKLY